MTMTFSQLEYALAQVQFTGDVSDADDVLMLRELDYVAGDLMYPGRLHLTAAGLAAFRAIPRDKRVAMGAELR